MEREYWRFIQKRQKDDRHLWKSLEEEPAILESEGKVVLKVLERNKSPVADGIPIYLFQATETESVKILTRLCQQIWKQNNGLQAGCISFTSQFLRKEMSRSAVTITPVLISHTNKEDV